LAASIGLVVVAVEVMRGELIAYYGLVLVVAALLGTASWNAWLILVSVNPMEHESRVLGGVPKPEEPQQAPT